MHTGGAMPTPVSLTLALRRIVQGKDPANASTRTRWPTWRRGGEQWAGSSSPSSCDRSRNRPYEIVAGERS